MSADNGYIIRKHEGFYWLDMYMASSDELPPVEKGTPYSTLEEACVAYAEMSKSPNLASEYGLTINIDGEKSPDWPSYGIDASLWARAFIRDVRIYDLATVTKWFAMAIEAGHKTSNQKRREYGRARSYLVSESKDS